MQDQELNLVCGTPNNKTPGNYTGWLQSLKFKVNQSITLPYKPNSFSSQEKRTSWSIVSNITETVTSTLDVKLVVSGILTYMQLSDFICE